MSDEPRALDLVDLDDVFVFGLTGPELLSAIACAIRFGWTPGAKEDGE